MQGAAAADVAETRGREARALKILAAAEDLDPEEMGVMERVKQAKPEGHLVLLQAVDRVELEPQEGPDLAGVGAGLLAGDLAVEAAMVAVLALLGEMGELLAAAAALAGTEGMVAAMEGQALDITQGPGALAGAGAEGLTMALTA